MSDSTDGDAGDTAADDLGAESGSSAAGPQGSPDDDDVSENWNDGTSPERQDRARKLYREANKLVEVAALVQAVRTYKQALAHWDHPKIRYNLAVVLMETGQPIEAYENILIALRHGVEGLGPDNHKRAMTDRRVLQAGLVSVSIRSQQSDVQVTLDGKSVASTPDQARALIRPGEHQLLAQGGGYGTITFDYPFWPDRHYDITVDPSRGIQRYWRQWIPWSVLGAGVALSSMGGAFHWRARSNFNEFDARAIEACRDGCPPGTEPPELTSLENRARIQGRVAAVLYAVGAAATVSGISLLIVNRPRRVHRDAFDIREGPFDITIAPVVSPGGVSTSGESRDDGPGITGVAVWATGSF